MEVASSSLTGVWQGRYAYPFMGAEVEFTATLLDVHGAVSGTTHEVDVFGETDVLYASLEGRRDGEAVRFLKRYEAAPSRYGTVIYDGVLGDNGHEISGRWSVEGWTGAFVMIRPRRQETEQKARKAERA